MKAKIYPVDIIPNTLVAPASPFCMQIEIVCASLAKGTTIIKNIVNSEEIDVTISFCESLGAIIKKVNDRLVIKGINNKLGYGSAIFDAKDSITSAMLFIPILCVIPQPFGIKGTERVINKIKELDEVLNSFGVNVYHEDDMIRYEDAIKPLESEVLGSLDISFITGLFICSAIINGNSKIKLRAPIRYEKTYGEVLKILKKFSIDIKHPNSMSYEINGNQIIKATKITNNMDNLLLAYYLLLANKTEAENHYLDISNLYFKKEQDDSKLLKLVVSNITTTNISLTKKKKFSPKENAIIEIECCSENALPFLMVLGYQSKYRMSINNVKFDKENVSEQFKIMTEAYKKLGIICNTHDEKIVIGNNRITSKTQVDCYNNKYCATALVFLALIAEAPITINNIDCINNYNSSILNDLKTLGVKIEYIHN